MESPKGASITQLQLIDFSSAFDKIGPVDFLLGFYIYCVLVDSAKPRDSVTEKFLFIPYPPFYLCITRRNEVWIVNSL